MIFQFIKKITGLLLLLFLAMNLFAQETRISGSVKDEKGEPLIGCNVLMKGTTSGTVSNYDGAFELDVNYGGDILIFSLIGFQTQEIQIADRNFIEVILKEDDIDLYWTPVIVYSYASKTERKGGYAYTWYRKNRHPFSIDRAIGQFFGINRANSGSLASNSGKLQMRAANSALNTEPIITINGLPIDNSVSGAGVSGVNNSYRINDLVEDDIDHYKVFRIGNDNFGTSSPNGTVAIEYNNNLSNSNKIEFTSRFSVQQVNKLPATQSTFAQGRPINGTETWRGPELGEVFSWGPRIDGLEYDGQDYDYDKNGMLVPLGTGNAMAAKTFDKESFFGLGTIFENSLLFTRNKGEQEFKFCYSNMQEKGTIRNTGLERNNLNVHYKYIFERHATIKFNTLLSNLKGKRAFQGNNSSGILYGLLLSPPTFDLGNGKTGKAAANDNTSYQLGNGGQRSFSPIAENPYWSINKNKYQDETNRIISDLNLELSFGPVQFQNTTGIDYFWDNRNVEISPNSAHYINGRFTKRDETYKSLKSDSYLSYNYNYDWDFTAKLGHLYKNIDRKTERFDLFDTNSSAPILEQDNNKYRTQSNKIYGNFIFGTERFFHVNTSGSYEWLKHNSKKAGGLFSYSASGHIRFKELLERIHIYSVSYLGTYFTYSSWQKKDAVFVDPAFYNSLNHDIDDELYSFEKLGVSNFSDARPETINSMEMGFLLYINEGRMNIKANYFNNKTKDLVLPSNLTSTSCELQNGGQLRSQGYELQFFYLPFTRYDFKWEINANFSKYKTVVEELPDGTDRVPIGGFSSVSTNLIEGEEYGVIWGSRYLRDSEGRKIIGGDGFPLVDTENGVIGNPNPDWTVNIGNKITRNGVTLKFLVNIKKGGQVWNGTKNVLDYYGMSKNTGDLRHTSNYVFDGVDLNGNENTMSVDFANPANPVEENRWVRYGKHGVAEDAIEDASWIRLSELSIGYNFSNDFTRRLEIRYVGISFFAKNLLLFTNYSGIDPDTYLPGTTNGAGLDYFNLPNVRSYGVELKIEF